MEAMVKKYQQKFRRVRNELDRWEGLQFQMLSYFGNAAAIIERLQVIQDSKNYGVLSCVNGIGEVVLQKQMNSLQTYLFSMEKTLKEFHDIVLCLEKMERDGWQLFKSGSYQPTVKQLQQRVGIKPSIADCLDGLALVRDMYSSEYHLKVSIVSAVSILALKPSASDLSSLQQLLADQPNIPEDEVKLIFDIIFAEDNY